MFCIARLHKHSFCLLWQHFQSQLLWLSETFLPQVWGWDTYNEARTICWSFSVTDGQVHQGQGGLTSSLNWGHILLWLRSLNSSGYLRVDGGRGEFGRPLKVAEWSPRKAGSLPRPRLTSCLENWRNPSSCILESSKMWHMLILTRIKHSAFPPPKNVKLVEATKGSWSYIFKMSLSLMTVGPICLQNSGHP